MFQTTFIESGAGVCFVATGAVTADEIRRAKTALAACDNGARQIRFAIVDFQEATELTMSIDDLRRLIDVDMRLAALTPAAVVAIVAPKEHMFGMARMWESLAEATGWKTGVFRSSTDACRWVAQRCALN